MDNGKAANRLAPSFRLLQDAVEECSKIVVVDGNYKDTNGDDTTSCVSKKVKSTSDDTPSKAAPTSFSLFDMMDAQKGSFVLPPRVMAYQVLETYELEQSGNSIEDGKSTTLELLEKADDMEDLSPDQESWEEIRTILYNGLINTSNLDEASRYLEVHISLHEKCRSNNALTNQLWGLAQNMVGCLLHFSNQFEEEKTTFDSSKHTMDLCWDTTQAILNVLSKMAEDYVMSAVGNESEIERMVLGICLILSNDYLAYIMGMIEPMSGFLEVWSRFVDPSKFMSIIQVSGLGGIVLRRCQSLGKNDSSETIYKMIQSTEIVDSDNNRLLADMEHSNFLQSLSILRTILFRCGGSHEVVSLVHDQFTSGITVSCTSFVMEKGVASTNDVQAILKKTVTEANEGKHLEASTTFDDMKAVVLKPYHTELKMKKNKDLELLCTQTIQLLG